MSLNVSFPFYVFELTFFNILTNITNKNIHICGRKSRRGVFPHTGIPTYEIITIDPCGDCIHSVPL